MTTPHPLVAAVAALEDGRNAVSRAKASATHARQCAELNPMPETLRAEWRVLAAQLDESADRASRLLLLTARADVARRQS